MRIDEPGWIRCMPLDDAGRRSIWFRNADDTCIEVCAGREGDDNYVKLKAGKTLRREEIYNLRNAFETGRWLTEDRIPPTELSCEMRAALVALGRAKVIRDGVATPGPNYSTALAAVLSLADRLAALDEGKGEGHRCVCGGTTIGTVCNNCGLPVLR